MFGVEMIYAAKKQLELEAYQKRVDAIYRGGKTPDELIQAARQKQIDARVKVWKVMDEKAR